MKAVILAAGESSRFKPLSDKRHKALTHVLGKPIIQHTVEELNDAGIDETIVVQCPERKIGEEVGADRFVVQEEPKGMADALKQAEEFLDQKFLVLTPYRSQISKLLKPVMQRSEESETVLVSSYTDQPEKYGILDLEDGEAVDIVEKPSEDPPSDRKVVGMYLLSPDFFDHMEEVETWEYQYEDALSRQLQDSPAPVVEAGKETNSIKHPWDLFDVMEELLGRSQRKISEEAEIADSAQLKGKVIVEGGAKIFENAVVKGPAYIGRNAVVGNNALVRENSCVEDDATVGANCEVKNSSFQPGSSMHSGFIGDSVVGRNSSIGAGTIVANRRFREEGERPEISSKLIAKDRKEETGRTYLGCFIGEDVDIGVNCSIMPGVQIGSDSRIEPGEVVKQNVERRRD
jgi:bifunctional UDP-N-acetylglucosamine pyrophosphorylase/glucosamine-1-phosphate N-acetyltransferase